MIRDFEQQLIEDTGTSEAPVAGGLGSGAMKADSKQAVFCAYRSGILLAGLLLNALLHWWWGRSVGGAGMVPIIAREGWSGLKGKAHFEDSGRS